MHIWFKTTIQTRVLSPELWSLTILSLTSLMAWFHRYRYDKMGSLTLSLIWKSDFQVIDIKISELYFKSSKFWKFFGQKQCIALNEIYHVTCIHVISFFGRLPELLSEILSLEITFYKTLSHFSLSIRNRLFLMTLLIFTIIGNCAITAIIATFN